MSIITNKEIDKLSVSDLLELEKALELAKKAIDLTEMLRAIKESIYGTSIPNAEEVVFTDSKTGSKVLILPGGKFKFVYRIGSEGYYKICFLNPDENDIYNFLKSHDTYNMALNNLWQNFLVSLSIFSTISL